VDEAYIEFAARASLAKRIDEIPNLVVLRTLSKAYALAGARLGTLVAGEDIVSLLRRIIPPYAIPASTVEQVLALTEAPQRAMAADRIRTLLGEREQASRRLAAMRCVVRVHPSDANFLLVQFRDAGAALEAGKDVGLLVRDFSSAPGLAGCLRISIGTPEQNERLLAALECL
jgi:histidinol-phosphate/aromatic aminotransferase/cobyric acid decarboxylase-like protein